MVAADGIHSALQAHVVPPSRPVFHGKISYRGLVSAERLPGWPMDRWLMWAGPSKHFLVFPVRHGTMVNYVGFVPTDEEMKESWSAPGDPQELRQAFDGWDPRIGDVLAQVDRTFRWALYDREPLPTWSHGRLTLLGDAAHPMLPHLGQGANQSVEDGMALATLLAQTDAARVPAALQAYERLRRERVAEIQHGARSQRPARRLRSDGPEGARRATRGARRVPQAAVQLRRGAGGARRGRPHLTRPVFFARSLTRLSSSRVSAICCSGVA